MGFCPGSWQIPHCVELCGSTQRHASWCQGQARRLCNWQHLADADWSKAETSKVILRNLQESPLHMANESCSYLEDIRLWIVPHGNTPPAIGLARRDNKQVFSTTRKAHLWSSLWNNPSKATDNLWNSRLKSLWHYTSDKVHLEYLTQQTDRSRASRVAASTPSIWNTSEVVRIHLQFKADIRMTDLDLGFRFSDFYLTDFGNLQLGLSYISFTWGSFHMHSYGP